VHTYLASRPLEHPMYVCVCAWGEKAKPIYSIYFTRAPACHPSDLPHISTYFSPQDWTSHETGLMRLGKPTPPRIQTRDCLTLIYDPTLQMYTAPFPTTGLLAQSMHPTPPHLSASASASASRLEQSSNDPAYTFVDLYLRHIHGPFARE